jgi:F420 biosynthesis protein FbiB-like protein
MLKDSSSPANRAGTVPQWAAALLLGRHSVRRYAQRPVERGLIMELLHLATHAPSAHNRQPWRFMVLGSGNDRTRLADAMGERLCRDRLLDGDDPGAVQADIDRSRVRIQEAPVVILVSLSMEDMDPYPDARRQAAERVMATQGTAMAVQNLLLAASSAGLGGCWMCAPLFCADAVVTALDLPPRWEPQALITLGYPEGLNRLRARRPLTQIAKFR